MKEEIRVKLLDKYSINKGKVKELVEDENNNGVVDDDTFSPITPTLVFAAFVSLLASLSFGLVIGYSSPVQSEMMKELNLSTSQFSLFGSMNSIGAAVGAILCGKLADFLGRKRALGLADIIFTLGWFSIAICKDAWLLDLGRWMLGFAMSITGFVVPVFIAEFTPRKRRGGFVVLHVLMVTAGASLVFLLGLIFPWRTLALIGIIPSLVQIVCLFFIPESPRWLMMIGQNVAFEASLQRFRGAKSDTSLEMYDIKLCAEALKEKQSVNLLQLFQKKYAYTLTVGFGLSSLSMLVGLNGIIAYSRSIFESAGFSGIIGVVAVAVLQLPSVILGVFLTDKCGRRPLLMISSAGLFVGCMLAGMAFAFQDHKLLEGISPFVALIGILVYVAAYPVGVGGVSAVIISEIYPLNIKGLAGSVSTLLGALSGWLVAYAFNFSMEWSTSGTFFVLGGVCATTLIFVARFVPETKGKTLEEVHLQMSNVWQ